METYLNRVRTRWLWTAGLKGGRFNPSFSERDKKQMIDLREISTNWFKIQLYSSIRLSRLRAQIYRINRTVMRAGRTVLCSQINGASWPSSRPLYRSTSWMSVENWWPWDMQSDTNLWHPSNSMKASNSMKVSSSRDVGNSKDPSSNRNASFKQGTPTGEGTTSTAKTPATAGSVWKTCKSGRKWSQKYGCEWGGDKIIASRERSPSCRGFC